MFLMHFLIILYNFFLSYFNHCFGGDDGVERAKVHLWNNLSHTISCLRDSWRSVGSEHLMIG